MTVVRSVKAWPRDRSLAILICLLDLNGASVTYVCHLRASAHAWFRISILLTPHERKAFGTEVAPVID